MKRVFTNTELHSDRRIKGYNSLKFFMDKLKTIVPQCVRARHKESLFQAPLFMGIVMREF